MPDIVFNQMDSVRQPLAASVEELTKFIDCIFPYTSQWVQLRCFYDKGENRTGLPMQPWKSVRAGQREKLVSTAVAVATEAANHPQKVVFCPPCCTFNGPYAGSQSGRENDIAEGPVISTEIDKASPRAGLERLAAVLGVPTVILHSGGIYENPETGEREDKLHLHWRLTEPATTREELELLKECRRLCTLIANGDGSNVPAVHPVRWAGSFHRKGEPRMACGEYHRDREVELQWAYEALKEAEPAEAREAREPKVERTARTERAPAEYRDILSAIDAIPNDDLDYELWKEIGAAIRDGTGDTPAGLAAFHAFSQKSSKYDPGGTSLAWKQLCDCPYENITVGTLYHLARQADPNWISPTVRLKLRQQQMVQQREAIESINSLASSSQADHSIEPEQADTVQAYIEELAQLDKVNFYSRLDEAAKKLTWTKAHVEAAVKDVRRVWKKREKAGMGEAGFEDGSKQLNYGSDAEIADRVRDDMLAGDSLYVHTEGAFFGYNVRIWEQRPDAEIIEQYVLAYDGARYGNTRVRMNQTNAKSILSFLAHKMGIRDFFAEKVPGVALDNGFVALNRDGTFNLVAHDPTQLSRHLLPGRFLPDFKSLPPASLLHRFFATMLRNDAEAAEKLMLLQELVGASLIGASKVWLPQLKAVILLGRSANNGKTEYIALCEALTGGACSHVPAHEFDERNAVVQLRGALLNTAGELTSSQAIASDVFKKCVTNEVVLGKFLYKDIVEFRPMAQHIFATNKLPPFAGGIDKGCRRRLLVLEFNRSIPVDEMIPDIAAKIIETEYDLLLNWAIQGASRLLRQRGFTVPESSNEALDQWVRDTDAVVSWIKERVRECDNKPGDPGVKPSVALDHFYQWAEANHYDKRYLPKMAEFCARMADAFPGCKRTAKSNRLRGIEILTADPPDILDDLRNSPPSVINDAIWGMLDKTDQRRDFIDRMMSDD